MAAPAAIAARTAASTRLLLSRPTSPLHPSSEPRPALKIGTRPTVSWFRAKGPVTAGAGPYPGAVLRHAAGGLQAAGHPYQPGGEPHRRCRRLPGSGYEVHFNLSPVVLRPGWQRDWARLLEHVDDVLPGPVKDQAAAEVIMLTQNEDLHDLNLGWHPRAEEALWRPELQQPKRSENGSWNVRYRNGVKAGAVETMRALVATRAPWLRIRYAF